MPPAPWEMPAAPSAAVATSHQDSDIEDGREAKRARLEDAGGKSGMQTDVSTAMRVAQAYDAMQEVGFEGRQQSKILHLKNLNNWMKAALIREYAPKPCTAVLDLACGKLGDLFKWKMADVRYYCGVDISEQGILDARERFNNASGGVINGKLVRADLGATDLTAAGVLGEHERFEAISIQFALHYLFQTEARALTFFKNIACRCDAARVN